MEFQVLLQAIVGAITFSALIALEFWSSMRWTMNFQSTFNFKTEEKQTNYKKLGVRPRGKKLIRNNSIIYLKPQVSHLYGLSFEWTLCMCLVRKNEYLYAFPHTSHIQSLLPAIFDRILWYTHILLHWVKHQCKILKQSKTYMYLAHEFSRVLLQIRTFWTYKKFREWNRTQFNTFAGSALMILEKALTFCGKANTQTGTDIQLNVSLHDVHLAQSSV